MCLLRGVLEFANQLGHFTEEVRAPQEAGITKKLSLTCVTVELNRSGFYKDILQFEKQHSLEIIGSCFKDSVGDIFLHNNSEKIGNY